MDHPSVRFPTIPADRFLFCNSILTAYFLGVVYCEVLRSPSLANLDALSHLGEAIRLSYGLTKMTTAISILKRASISFLEKLCSATFSPFRDKNSGKFTNFKNPLQSRSGSSAKLPEEGIKPVFPFPLSLPPWIYPRSRCSAPS